MSDSTGPCSTAAVRIQGQVQGAGYELDLTAVLSSVEDKDIRSKAASLLVDLWEQFQTQEMTSGSEAKWKTILGALKFINQEEWVTYLQNRLQGQTQIGNRTSTAVRQPDAHSDPRETARAVSENRLHDAATYTFGGGAAASKTSRTSTAAGQTDGTQPPATALWSPQGWNRFQAGTTHGSGAGAAASSGWSHSLPPAGWAGSGMQMQGQGEPNPAMGGWNHGAAANWSGWGAGVEEHGCRGVASSCVPQPARQGFSPAQAAWGHAAYPANAWYGGQDPLPAIEVATAPDVRQRGGGMPGRRGRPRTTVVPLGGTKKRFTVLMCQGVQDRLRRQGIKINLGTRGHEHKPAEGAASTSLKIRNSVADNQRQDINADQSADTEISKTDLEHNASAAAASDESSGSRPAGLGSQGEGAASDKTLVTESEAGGNPHTAGDNANALQKSNDSQNAGSPDDGAATEIAASLLENGSASAASSEHIQCELGVMKVVRYIKGKPDPNRVTPYARIQGSIPTPFNTGAQTLHVAADLYNVPAKGNDRIIVLLLSIFYANQDRGESLQTLLGCCRDVWARLAEFGERLSRGTSQDLVCAEFRMWFLEAILRNEGGCREHFVTCPTDLDEAGQKAALAVAQSVADQKRIGFDSKDSLALAAAMLTNPNAYFYDHALRAVFKGPLQGLVGMIAFEERRTKRGHWECIYNPAYNIFGSDCRAVIIPFVLQNCAAAQNKAARVVFTGEGGRQQHVLLLRSERIERPD